MNALLMDEHLANLVKERYNELVAEAELHRQLMSLPRNRPTLAERLAPLHAPLRALLQRVRLALRSHPQVTA
jgi:flagellar biosynthesis component FlhA